MRRKLVNRFAFAIAVAAVAFVLFLSLRRSPYLGVYEQVMFGMTEQEIESLLSQPGLEPVDNEGGHETFLSLRWEAIHQGKHHRLHTSEFPQDFRPLHLRPQADQMMRYAGSNAEVIDQDGRVLMRRRIWGRDGDALAVTFDAEGRAVEKELWTWRPSSPWWRWFKSLLGIEPPSEAADAKGEQPAVEVTA